MAAVEEAAGARLDCSPFLAVMGRSFFKGGGQHVSLESARTSDPLTSRSVEESFGAAAAAAAAVC